MVELFFHVFSLAAVGIRQPKEIRHMTWGSHCLCHVGLTGCGSSSVVVVVVVLAVVVVG